MFSPTSNKSISIMISENGGYVIQYYDAIQATDAMPQSRYQMKILTAHNVDDATNIVREVLIKMQ